MKFQLIVLQGCLIFTHTILRTSKSIGNNTMKKCYSLLRWPAQYTLRCAQQTFTVQNKPAAVAPRGKPSPIISSFLELGRRKLSMQPKFVAAQKMLLKLRKPKANIRKWLLRFLCAGHLYSAGSACVLLTIIAWVAHRYGQLYLHCSLIYFWVPSSCFA